MYTENFDNAERKNDMSKLLTPDEIGIYFDDKGVERLDPKQFAKFAAKKWQIIYFHGEFYRYVAGCWKLWPLGGMRKTLFSFIEKFSNVHNLGVEGAYINYLKLIRYDEKGFNKNHNLMNFKNGVLNLNDMNFMEHSPKFRSSIQLPYSYNKEAKCPRFMEFLSEIFLGDKEMIDVIQEIMGYCISCDNEAQKFFIFYGQGSNGKSVLCELLRELAGRENCSSLSIKDLGQRFSVADLEGKPLNLSTENESANGRAYNSQYIKAISGGDFIKAEKKMKDVYTFQPFCKLIFSANNYPKFNDYSFGFYRRIMVIPFEATFDKESGTADVHLLDKLQAELPGILNFALEGLMRLRKNGYVFSRAAKIENSLKWYRQAMNPYRAFFDEYITFTKNDRNRIKCSDVWKRFCEWAAENGQAESRYVSANKFWSELKKAVPELSGRFKKSNGYRFIIGFSLR